LQPDGKNRAMLRSFLLVPGRYPDSATLLQPTFAQQRLQPLLPGRYKALMPVFEMNKMNQI
jgi:hypothetical protein